MSISTRSFDEMLQQYRARIVVQLPENRNIDFDGLFLKEYSESDNPTTPGSNDQQFADVLPWQALKNELGQFRFTTLFRDIRAGEITELQEEAAANVAAVEDPSDLPNLLAYYSIEVPQSANIDRDQLREIAASLYDPHDPSRGVALDAYLEGLPERPTGGGPTSYVAQQTYLRERPAGVGARYALDRNLTGASVRVADIEQGWMIGHEDLDRVTIPVWGMGLGDPHTVNHGTAILGILNADNDTTGCVGIASGATPLLISQWESDGDYNTPSALMQAIRRPWGVADRLRAGDVLLIEAQTRVEDDGPLVPIEIQGAVRSVITLAYRLGVTVVEAAGNGTTDLSLVENHRGERVLARGTESFLDSRAIIVGAARGHGDPASARYERWLGSIVTLPSGRREPRGSNFGSRIDCFAHGAEVVTLTSYRKLEECHATKYLTVRNGGTSTAAAMVAGVAAVVQGVARAQGEKRVFTPGTVRALLSDRNNGTEKHNPHFEPIGVMPDLSKVIPKLPKPDQEVSDSGGASVWPGAPRVPGLAAPRLPLRTWARPRHRG
jgi:hypothetical protein